MRHSIELLRQVEIPSPETAVEKFSFELSGGMRQRAVIAMALACGPEVLIADEPTTALDVTTHAEILRLIRRLQVQKGLAVLFITHDMGVVAQIADDVLLMYRGEVVERGTVEEVFHRPVLPDTRSLLEASRKLGMAAPSAAPPAPSSRILLRARDLGMIYPTAKALFHAAKPSTQALSGASFDMVEGENLGTVGESGSGKTTLGNFLMRILIPTTGRIEYTMRDDQMLNLATLPRPGLRPKHREIRMVFQDPFASLNPRMTVGQVVGEPLLGNNILSG